MKHNLYQQSKWSHTKELSTTHIILFKVTHDIEQYINLGKQLNLATFLQNCYELATKKKFGHLLVDLDLKTSDCLQYCSKIVEPSPSITSDKAEVAAITNEREKHLFSSDKRMVQLSRAEIRKYIRTSHKKVTSVLCECLHNVIRGNVKVQIHNQKQLENIFWIGFRKRTSLDKKTSQSPIKNRFWVILAHYSVLSCAFKLNNKMTITEDFILVPKKTILERPATNGADIRKSANKTKKPSVVNCK